MKKIKTENITLKTKKKKGKCKTKNENRKRKTEKDDWKNNKEQTMKNENWKKMNNSK